MPRDSVEEEERGEPKQEEVLTVDCGAGGCGLGDSALELDLQALLLDVGLVALLAVLPHPDLEGLADEGVDDVAEVLPGHLPDLPHDGEGLDDGGVGEAEVQDVVQREGLVVGDGDDLDVLAEDGLKERER